MSRFSNEPMTLAVLAGGESSRMGSPQTHLLVRGRPILEHLLDQWNWSGETMLVTAPGREKPPGWQQFDREVSDPVVGQGPLRGIVTALENCRTARLIVATCDMPMVPRELFDSLAATLVNQPDAIGVMTHRRDSDQLEPFPFVLRVSALILLRDRLRDGPRSIHSLASLTQFHVTADASPADIWTNLNDPADYQRFIAAQD